ncbi:hypothetical protein [Paraliobacillus sp. X-1268]|uniref:hypothetical protein n=1 Tax=Paraliobacillus sp. X-1268 TaxID=2213193 RepID=UPI001E4BE40F|nr:hypothetical protein [Paraliobacillus sp. X-1268]
MIDIDMVFIYAGILAVQYFFSTRNNVYWGAFIPVVFILFLTYMFVTNHIENIFAFILYLIVGMLFLLGQWFGGRESHRKRRRRELEKMESHDLK